MYSDNRLNGNKTVVNLQNASGDKDVRQLPHQIHWIK